MSTATELLAKYLAAEAAVLEGKEVRFQDRMVRQEDLLWIQRERRALEQRVANEQAAASGVPTIGGLTFARARFDGCD
jgi:hypothetical protein